MWNPHTKTRMRYTYSSSGLYFSFTSNSSGFYINKLINAKERDKNGTLLTQIATTK